MSEERGIDPETGANCSTPKWAPDGWHQVYHEIEFKTSKLDSIHDKGIDGNDLGFSSLKFFNADDIELTTQAEIDSNCVKTVFDFMPNFDFSIKSGKIAQITPPSTPIYLWCLAAPDLAPTVFCDGGINLEFLSEKTLVGLEGTAPTMMQYNSGIGSNKIRFIVRHGTGVQHRVQAIFEYFRE